LITSFLRFRSRNFGTHSSRLRFAGPHHRHRAHRPNSNLEAAYHNADAAIQSIVDVVDAA